MSGREQGEGSQVERFRIPHGDLPNLPLWVWVGPGRSSRGSNSLLDVCHWRRRRRRAVDTYTLRRRSIRRDIDRLLEEAVVSLAEESVESIEAAENGQRMDEESRLRTYCQPSTHNLKPYAFRYTHEPCEPSTSALSIDIPEHIVASSRVSRLARTSSDNEQEVERNANLCRPIVQKFLMRVVVQLFGEP
jgi:hypothetical protein